MRDRRERKMWKKQPCRLPGLRRRWAGSPPGTGAEVPNQPWGDPIGASGAAPHCSRWVWLGGSWRGAKDAAGCLDGELRGTQAGAARSCRTALWGVDLCWRASWTAACVGSVHEGWYPVGGTPEYRLEQRKSVRKEWERLSITDPCCPAPPKGVRWKKSGLKMSLEEELGVEGRCF